MGDNYFLLTNLLSEDERKVITSITAHIERGEKRVGVQQIAAENYLSTASIVKMCKRLGFDGYSELYYHLSRQFAASEKPTEETLRSLIDNYSGDLISGFCTLLHERRRGKSLRPAKAFPTSSEPISSNACRSAALWLQQRAFYDYMLFQEAHQRADADESAIMFAVSQSGETEPVLNDVRHAKQHGQRIISFTRRSDSTLAQLSDLVFVVDGAKQTLAGSLPNLFFGHIILIFEELMARFFSPDPIAQ